MLKARQKIRLGLLLGSFFLFPALFYYFSPALPLMAAGEGIVNGSLVVFGLLFLSALALGRAWCGWLCPAAGCQEALIPVRNRRISRGDLLKWLLWLPWIAAIAVRAWQAGGFRRIDLLYQTDHGLSIGNLPALITYLLVLIVLIVLPAYLVGRRSFCHHLCWMAPFLILGRSLRNRGRWPSLQLAAQPERCTRCHRCTRNCPMSLPIEDLVRAGRPEHHECILCGQCADGCPREAIRLIFR